MSPRLTSEMRVSAMLRRVNGEGGNACILRRGDPSAGAILIATRARGEFTGWFEAMLSGEGYRWQRVGPDDDRAPESCDWLQRRSDRDRDLWVVELDIPDATRFAAESDPTS